MKQLPATPGDTSAAKTLVDQRVGDNRSVTLILRPNAPPDFIARAKKAEGASPGRMAILIASDVGEILGDREAGWFGTDASVCAVSLRGDRGVIKLPPNANEFEINRAYLRAEAVQP